MLFIRACKSFRPNTRVRSVYNRQYTRYAESNQDFYIAGVLMRICEENLKISVSDIISDLHPDNWWRLGLSKTDGYWTAVTRLLTSKIRLTAIDQFPNDFIKPIISRK